MGSGIVYVVGNFRTDYGFGFGFRHSVSYGDLFGDFLFAHGFRHGFHLEFSVCVNFFPVRVVRNVGFTSRLFEEDLCVFGYFFVRI